MVQQRVTPLAHQPEAQARATRSLACASGWYDLPAIPKAVAQNAVRLNHAHFSFILLNCTARPRRSHGKNDGILRHVLSASRLAPQKIDRHRALFRRDTRFGIALTGEVGGCARPNHPLTQVVSIVTQSTHTWPHCVRAHPPALRNQASIEHLSLRPMMGAEEEWRPRTAA